MLDRRIILDFPPTAVTQLHRLNYDLTAIDILFISHLHADHMFGLPFFLLEYCIRYQREEPVYIIGPPSLENVTHTLCELAWPNMRKKGLRPRVPVVFLEVEEGTHRIADLEFDAIPMRHFNLEAFAYRFAYEGRTFAYSGDTGECEQLNRLMKDADVVILEMTHPREDVDPEHLDAAAVVHWAKVARQGGAKVFATHMSEIPEPIEGVTLCEDGRTYWV